MELFLIRHGQSFNNTLSDAEGRVAAPPLTETGEKQAERVAVHLRDAPAKMIFGVNTGSPDQQALMLGFSRWFPATRKEQEANSDIRLSIEERYESRDSYIELVKRDTKKLTQNRFILEQDVDLVVQNATDRYDTAVARTSD